MRAMFAEFVFPRAYAYLKKVHLVDVLPQRGGPNSDLIFRRPGPPPDAKPARGPRTGAIDDPTMYVYALPTVGLLPLYSKAYGYTIRGVSRRPPHPVSHRRRRRKRRKKNVGRRRPEGMPPGTFSSLSILTPEETFSEKCVFRMNGN